MSFVTETKCKKLYQGIKLGLLQMGWLFFYKIVRIVKFYETDLRGMMEFLIWTRRRLDKYST